MNYIDSAVAVPSRTIKEACTSAFGHILPVKDVDDAKRFNYGLIQQKNLKTQSLSQKVVN
ncbi:MAG: hypothetical protein L3J17_15605 [Candidatus Jettenia sp.]|nr:MAG: hypothetical protein L3J17_15605 [Candidatus Jettenia sp.]